MGNFEGLSDSDGKPSIVSAFTVGNVALSAARRSRVGKHTGSAAVMIVTRQTAPFLRFPRRELRSNRKISDIDNEIARISEQNLVLVRLKSKGYVDSALYLSQMDEIEHKLRELRKLRRRLLETAGEDRQIQETERMLEYLTDSPEWLDEVTSDLFRELIERITIISPTRLKFRLLNGLELSESIERMVR